MPDPTLKVSFHLHANGDITVVYDEGITTHDLQRVIARLAMVQIAALQRTQGPKAVLAYVDGLIDEIAEGVATLPPAAPSPGNRGSNVIEELAGDEGA